MKKKNQMKKTEAPNEDPKTKSNDPEGSEENQIEKVEIEVDDEGEDKHSNTSAPIQRGGRQHKGDRGRNQRGSSERGASGERGGRGQRGASGDRGGRGGRGQRGASGGRGGRGQRGASGERGGRRGRGSTKSGYHKAKSHNRKQQSSKKRDFI